MKISASTLHVALACGPSALLPHVDERSPIGQRGSAIHQFLSDVSTKGRDEALTYVDDDYYAACEAIDVSGLPACEPESFASEVAFAFDVQTGVARELGRGLPRSTAYASLTPSEIGGTADCIGVAPTSVIVPDYKTGWGEVAAPRDNWQLRFYALCAARVYQRDRAEVILIRIRSDGSAWSERAVFEKEELDAFAQLLKMLVSKIQLAEQVGLDRLSYTMGQHCQFCKAMRFCPAVAGATQVFVTAHPTVPTPESVASDLTPERAPTLLMQLRMAKKLIGIIEEGIDLYATQAPFAMPNGKVYGPTTRTTEHIDGGVAFRVLTRAFGQEAADRTVKLMVSKTAIRDACRTAAKDIGSTIKDVEEQILNKIREGGGASKRTTRTIAEHKPEDDSGKGEEG